MTKEYMLGNVAIARGIRESGVGLVAGYPGTPSSEIIDNLRAQKDLDFYIEWSVNEKVALEVAIGAAFTGTRALATMKHVGLNVAADPLMSACFAENQGGLVILTADDPSLHSSQNEQDTRRYAYFAQVPCLDPATIQDAKDMIPYAFEFSEKFKTPVIIRPTTRICHAKAGIEIGEIKPNPNTANFIKDPTTMVMMPTFARPRHPISLERQKPMMETLEQSPWNVLELCDGSKIGVISSGIASVYAKEALHILGINASFLKIMTYPVPENMILQMLNHCDKILVVEELEPIVEDRVRILAQQNQITTEIIGKNPVPQVYELNLEICRDIMASVFKEQADTSTPAFKMVGNVPPLPAAVRDIVLPPRPPAFCVGCSHRSAFHVIKEVFGKNAIFPSDIGCYTLGIHTGMVDTVICMGGSISMAAGIANSGEKRPVCCTIGDSTFLHTGINSLMNAVYNGANMTVAILDNYTTAMTGQQPNPSTKLTAIGNPAPDISLEAVCKSFGTEFVRTVDAFDYEALKTAFREAKNFNGVSVVIVQQTCSIVAKKAGTVRLSSFAVVADKCKGCRKCVNFGCPAVEFDKSSGLAFINAHCFGCGVCAQICSFDAIVEVK